MPNYLAIDAHPIPAGEARVDQLEADIALVVNSVVTSMAELSRKVDKLQLYPN